MSYQPPSEPGQQPQWGQQPSQPLSQPEYPPPTYYQQPPPPPPYPQPGAFQQPPQPKKPKRRIWLWIIGVILVLGIIGGIASAFSSNSNTNTPAAQATQPAQNNTTQAPAQPTATPKPTQKPTPSFATFGDGTFQVGKDIQPGTYRTRVGSSNCYYERLKGFSGSTDDIIANNNTDFPAIVTIQATDKGFTSQNCGTWTKDLSRITASKTSFDDGMFIVNTDITPGTYKDTGGDGCYYARLSGFGNTTDDILANNLVTAPAIVTISATDKGFETKGCGTWKKL
ncbi:MAG TPA: hypothetical protein VF043_30245 [Ktedonobacteraceae bacterium]